MAGHVTLPNLISTGRILLVPAVVWLMAERRFDLAFWGFAIAGISDGIDGFIARHWNLRSRLGAFLDPLADKLLLVSSFVTLGLLGMLPDWLVILVVARDLLIVGGVLLGWVLGADAEPHPSLVSKANTLCQILLAGAVLCVLMGLLLPALEQAQASARMASCNSRLHQFNTALTMYAEDFEKNIAIYKVAFPNAYEDSIGYPYGLALLLKQGYVEGGASATPLRKAESAWCPSWSASKSWLACYNMRLLYLTTTVKAGFSGNMAQAPTALVSCRYTMVTKPSLFISAADPMQNATDSYLMHGSRYNAMFLDGHCQTITDDTDSIRLYMVSNAPSSLGPNASRTCFNLLYAASGITGQQY